MKRKSFLISAIMITIMLSLFSCRKEIEHNQDLPGSGSPQENTNAHEQRIYVSNVAELYAAVNDPDNAGSRITLAPGEYILNAVFPNGGRLELQTNMKLQGQPGQTEAVTIDQSLLPNSSYRLTPTVSTGGIRVGRGSNSIEWITLKGGSLAANPFSVIESDLIGNQSQILISHVKMDCNGSRIGFMLRNRLDEHAGRILNAKLEFSEIWGAVNATGLGIALQNRISGAEINLDMKDNFVHSNKVGIVSFNGGLNNSIMNCKTEIISYRDRLEGNGCAMDPCGATNGSSTMFANNNSFSLKMFGSVIKDNNPPGHSELIPTNGALPGGVFAAGGFNSLNNVSAFNTVSGNSAILKFWGCTFSNNNAPDFYAYGLWSATNAVLAGTNNVLEIYLNGVSANATVQSLASIPVDPAGTNLVNVYR
jgi:hypothetical protein